MQYFSCKDERPKLSEKLKDSDLIFSFVCFSIINLATIFNIFNNYMSNNKEIF